MSRSRFEKLEGQRPETDDVPAADKALDARFGAEPEHAPAPTASALPELSRFDTDGGDGLGLDRDPLAELPMLQCPSCQADCGKFEQTCARCGASLTSDAARAHNLARVETLRAQRALEQQAEAQRREDQIRERAVDRIKMDAAQHAFADDLRAQLTGDSKRSPAWPWFVAATVCFGLARLLPWFAARVIFIAAGTVCLLTRLPQSAWIALGKESRGRGRF